jgi:hypothetical protein
MRFLIICALLWGCGGEMSDNEQILNICKKICKKEKDYKIDWCVTDCVENTKILVEEGVKYGYIHHGN